MVDENVLEVLDAPDEVDDENEGRLLERTLEFDERLVMKDIEVIDDVVEQIQCNYELDDEVDELEVCDDIEYELVIIIVLDIELIDYDENEFIQIYVERELDMPDDEADEFILVVELVDDAEVIIVDDDEVVDDVILLELPENVE